MTRLPIVAAAFAFLIPSTFAQSPLTLMPAPGSVTRGEGALIVTPAAAPSSFTFAFGQTHDDRLEAATRRALTRLGRTCGGEVLRSTIDHAGAPNPSLLINVAAPGGAVQALDDDESYQLSVTPQQATLSAANDLGALHGLETLLQLATIENGQCIWPAVSIHDAPRFRWRGLMLDVSRHFEPVGEVERTLDGMAAAKLNVFHWHLSDDQAFRAESKKYPKLTQIAAEGEFYTQEQMREVVAYAHDRGIRVVPEFDMPGHGSSWILAYPDLDPGTSIKTLPVVYGMPTANLDPTRKSTYKFINTLVEEMSRIFPDAYFHIGGDEVVGKLWLNDPQIAAYMKKKGYAKPADLQAAFNRQLEDILKKHKKKMVGWDEILDPALPKTILIQSWRGEASLSDGARQGYQGILSAPYYLDAQKSAAQMYLADPLPADTTLSPAQQSLILGGEMTMWAEQLNHETVDSRVWPRALAVAERFWSPQSLRDLPDMYRRLRVNSLRLEDLGLQHISAPQTVRRNLAMQLDPQALDELASVLEPVDFHTRSRTQHTNGWSALDRLVDAVVADPPSRQMVFGDVDAIVGPSGAPDEKADAGDVPQGPIPTREAALLHLRQRFLAWQAAQTRLLEEVKHTPRLNDAGPRAGQLGDLAAVGLSALAYLESHTTPPEGWQARQLALIGDAEQPSALVRFTVLTSLRRLVNAAAKAP